MDYKVILPLDCMCYMKLSIDDISYKLNNEVISDIAKTFQEHDKKLKNVEYYNKQRLLTK